MSPSYRLLRLKTVIQHHQPFLEPIPHFSDKTISQAAIWRRFKKLKDKSSDVPSKSLQRCTKLEFVVELVGIVGKRPYCASNVSLSSLTDVITPLWDDWTSLVIRTGGQHGYTATCPQSWSRKFENCIKFAWSFKLLFICRSNLNWQQDVDLMQQLREKAGLLEAA